MNAIQSKHHQERLARFYGRFPRVQALRIEPVEHTTGLHELLDIEDVEGVLGAVRFQKLMAGLKTVYSCGHRTNRADHPDKNKSGAEVHSIAAADLEAFLAGGN